MSADNLREPGGVEDVPGLIHHRFEVAGGPISVYEAGDATKPKVVMFHGAMFDEARFTWDQLFPYLASDYHLFAFDTPRHGKSRPWTGLLTQDRLIEILRAAITHLGLERFSIVALSMGGGLAIGYAASFPDSVVSMALFEPGGLGDKTDFQLIAWLYFKTPWFSRFLIRMARKKKNHQAILKMLRWVTAKGTQFTDPNRLVGIIRDEAQGKYDHGEKDADDWQTTALGPFKLKWSLLDRIPLIQCPTLWLRGIESRFVKQHEMERAVTLARLGGFEATLRVFENAGHVLPLEQPTLANEAVKEFLDRTAAS
jgi:pimeloyl-ACP methyl ester carboxylesterase